MWWATEVAPTPAPFKYCAGQNGENRHPHPGGARQAHRAVPPGKISDQLTLTELQAVEQYAGVTCASVRPHRNDTVKQVAGQLGYHLVNWSVDTEDWKTQDSKFTTPSCPACLRRAIVLCHDLYESTATAMGPGDPRAHRPGLPAGHRLRAAELPGWRRRPPAPSTTSAETF